VEGFGASKLKSRMYVPERSARIEESEAVVSALCRIHGRNSGEACRHTFQSL
jgi:hypothetical protein